MILCLMAADEFGFTSQRNRPLIFGPILSKSGQLILDVRSITQDGGTDNAEATFTVPRDTYVKAIVTSDPVFRGSGHVRSHF